MAKLGVRSFLFLVLSTSAVLPVGLLGFNQARRWEQSEVESTDRQALAAARAAADQVSQTMLGFAHTCEAFSAHVAAVSGFEREGLKVALAAHVKHHPEFDIAYVADAAGTALLYIRADGEFVEGGLNYRDRSYYQEMTATHRTAISRVQLGRIRQLVSVIIASPVSDASGRLLGLTATSLDLAGITEQAKTAVRGMADGRVILVDGEGHIIADSSGHSSSEPRDVSKVALFAKVASGQTELRLGVDDAQQPVRGVAVGLKPPVQDWHVITTTPVATVAAHGRQVRNQTALFALALIFATLGLAAWLAAWLARPLRALAATADAVTRGEFSDALPVRESNAPREMSQLTEAVRSMIHKLREHALQLEGLVASRTSELSRTNRELESALGTIRENERRIHEDIEKARLFQARMLPALPKHEGLELAVHYAPLERVSGDIYDVVQLGPGQLRLFILDATGHGVQASMRTIFVKSAYDRLKLRKVDPSLVLSQLNEQLVAEFPEGELHSEACCLDLKAVPGGVEVTYASAGNTPLFVLSAGAPPREHYAGGPLLGVERLEWPKSERFQVASGELLLVCSDGLLEQWNSNRKRFDAELNEFRLEPAERAHVSLSRLLAAFHAFRGEQPVGDDITLLAVRVYASLDPDDPFRQPA